MKIKLGNMRSGIAGTAMEVITELERDDPLDWYAGVGNWWIDAPNQSPAWRHYMLSLVHLRPIEGVKPAVIRVPGATHEFMMMALDPGKNPQPLKPDTWSYLTPANLTEQVIVGNDAVAAKLLDYAATAITEGKLWAEPMLSGQFEPWRSWLNRWSRMVAS